MRTFIFAILLLFTQISNAKLFIIDVRTSEEYNIEHIAEAINIDVTKDSFKNEISTFNKEDDYEVYCRSGRRSAKATEIMNEMGFKKVINVGGLEDAKRKYNQK